MQFCKHIYLDAIDATVIILMYICSQLVDSWNNTSCCRCHLKTYLFRDCSALYRMHESIIVQPQLRQCGIMVQSRANVHFFHFFCSLLVFVCMDNRNSLAKDNGWKCIRQFDKDRDARTRLNLLSFIIVVQIIALFYV